MTGDGILVVGGYGAVGAVAARRLAEWFPGRVHVAGRDLAKARRAADTIGGAGSPLGAARVDVADPAALAAALAETGAGAVLLCVEPPDDALSRLCLNRGVHLVDIGASSHVLGRTERLDGEARAAGATAVLSVGLAPGLTNLLAHRGYAELGGADHIEISVLLGAGDRHGLDAVRWTVAGLAAWGRPTGGPARATLPGHGERATHPFPFSDQYTLRRTLGVPAVTTRFCLDSRPLTAGLFGLARLGLFRVAQRPRGLRLATAVLHRARLGGSDGWAIRADAHRGDRHIAHAMSGRDQSRTTGLVAAQVVREVLGGGYPAGVRHIEQLAGLAGIPERLAPDGIRLWSADELSGPESA